MNRVHAQFLLRALLAAGDVPMSDTALKASLRAAFFSERVTEADLNTTTRLMEERGWITGTADEFTGVLWTLTPKGRLRAQQLG